MPLSIHQLTGIVDTFSLGHLRSHKDEKPFMCPWPECGKSFARQHDCKRHQQLHSETRPHECGGCRKQFARMDALNRHCEFDVFFPTSVGMLIFFLFLIVRSEGGASCRRLLRDDDDEGNGIVKSEMNGAGMTTTMTRSVAISL